MIWKNKLNTSEAGTLTTRLLKTSEAGSILKEKDLNTYWNELSKELSQKLLSLTKTGSVGSDLTWSPSLLRSSPVGSWFSMSLSLPLKKNWLKTSSPSFTYSPADYMVLGNTVNRSKKIRIYLSKENRKLANKYFGLERYWFNAAVEYLKKKGTKAILSEVRRIQKDSHPDWAFDSPQRIRDHAFNQACKAVQNAKRKFAKEKVFQEVSFRSKKNSLQGFGFDKQSLNNDFVFSSKKYRLKFFATEPFKADKEGTRLVKEGSRFYLIIPGEKSILKPENQRNKVVALDPGVRTFQTFYSPEFIGKIGENAFSRIYRLCRTLDNLISRRSKAKSRRRYRMKKAEERIRFKIKSLISDLHKKTASFLVRNFEVILIPTFETSEMVKKLNNKTARNMLTLAHYSFKQFLKAKAEEFSCSVLEVSEAYTSKTCSYCGTMHNIGSKKVMKCCSTYDRDLNGARGIFLRALGASPFLEELVFENALL